MSTLLNVDSEIGGGDFASLPSGEVYSSYFKQLQRVWKHLADCYRLEPGKKSREAHAVRHFLAKLERTVELLQLKHAYEPNENRPFWIDVTESGFPNHLELAELGADVAVRSTLAKELPAMPVLKRALIDEIFRTQEEPVAVLKELSHRAYVEALDKGELFLPFTMGEIVPMHRHGAISRSYLVTFGCYDFATNRPYINFLVLEQAAKEVPLERKEGNYERLLTVLRSEGARAPDLAVLAMSIDEALSELHPKVLKRICLGPLYSRILLNNRSANADDPREAYFQELLLRFTRRNDDFILLLTEEAVFSKRQELSRTLFNPNGKTRQIYLITESDPSCAARRASVVNHYFLMPHELLQHVEPSLNGKIAEFSLAKKMTIDDSGEVHEH